MATANPLRENNYELELSRVRENIKTTFVELIDCLKARESELLRELDNILTSYLSYRGELEKVSEKKSSLERTKIFHQSELQTLALKSFHEDCMARVNTELKSIETPIEPKMVSLECDSNKMLFELHNLGKLVEKVREIDYKSKKQPIVSVSEKGKGINQLNWPQSVTVNNETGNLYVSDLKDHYVEVFDSTGKYLFKFGDNEDGGKMIRPIGVAICGDRILISEGNHCILNYQLNGKFISKIGEYGNGELEFDCPFGLTIDESNGNIYVSDYQNNRIQILSQDFRFISQFGKDILKSPLDVQLSKEYILILDISNPCLHLFNYNHILQKSVISRGKGMQVINSFFFFIDQIDNILISDYDSDSVRIFNKEFQLIHEIFVSPYPMGITVDKRGRVIVVCNSKNNCLQIF